MSPNCKLKASQVDYNVNGQQDTAETIGIANVPLNITGVNIGGDSVSITVTTDMTGHYLKEGLLPGNYTVTAPNGFGGYTRTSSGSRSTTLTLVITEDLTLDFGYVFPTAVQVQLLTVTASRGQVTLSWQAIGDPGLSFHVWRADNSKGVGAVQLTSQPVAGVTNAYQYVDNTVTRGQAYWYWLAEARDGQRYGPQAVTVPLMNIQAYLPAISR